MAIADARSVISLIALSVLRNIIANQLERAADVVRDGICRVGNADDLAAHRLKVNQIERGLPVRGIVAQNHIVVFRCVFVIVFIPCAARENEQLLRFAGSVDFHGFIRFIRADDFFRFLNGIFGSALLANEITVLFDDVVTSAEFAYECVHLHIPLFVICFRLSQSALCLTSPDICRDRGRRRER